MSFTIKVDRRGTSLVDRFRWGKIAPRWATSVGTAVTMSLKEHAPVGEKPGGRLRDSIHHTTQVSKNSVDIEFFVDVPYARFVINGTPPHIIRPKKAPILHWQDQGGDRYSMLVNHPGARANPFPRRALTPMLPLIKQRFKGAVIGSGGW